MALEKWANKTGEKTRNQEDYILQVIGMNDFLYGSNPLIKFKVRGLRLQTHYKYMLMPLLFRQQGH